jgi:hypothetical protein
LLELVAIVAALFALGASPPFIPMRVALRLSLWLLILLATLWIFEFRADHRHGWHMLVILPVWAGLGFSLLFLIGRHFGELTDEASA